MPILSSIFNTLKNTGLPFLNKYGGLIGLGISGALALGTKVYNSYNKPQPKDETGIINSNFTSASLSSQGSMDLQNQLVENNSSTKDANTFAQQLLDSFARNSMQKTNNKNLGGYDGRY